MSSLNSSKPLLDIEQLVLGFANEQTQQIHPVVHGVSLQVFAGEIVGILGESGSGKTVTMKSIFGVAEEDLVIQRGHLFFDAVDLRTLKTKEWQMLRGKSIAYIPQNASDALTPHQSIGKQLKEIAKVHKIALSKDQLIKKFLAVGIENPETILAMYPHQLSGGLAQRVVIAMSTVLKPKLIIADEPTSAIDASLKGTILALLKSINEAEGTAIVLITHDFEVVSEMCHRVYVMYKGMMMEAGPAAALLEKPLHPYTQELIRCVQSLSDQSPHFYSMKEVAADVSEV